MKKVLLVLGAVILLLVAAVIAIPFLVPTETLVATAVEQGEKATGRKITVGDASFSVLPTTKVTLVDVTMANAEGGKADKLARLKSLDVEVDLFAILGGDVQVKRFVLIDPVINIEKDKSGRFNFEFEPPEAQPQSGTTTSDGEGDTGGADIQSIRLDDVRIENAALNYADLQTGVSHSVSDVNASISLPGLDQPMKFDGDLVWQGKKITIATQVDDPNAAIQGAETALSANVSSDLFNIGFNGKAGQKPAIAASGKASVEAGDLPALLNWIGAAMGPDVKLPKAISLTTDVNLALPKIALAGLTFQFDGNKITGAARSVLGGKPSLYADLSAGDLDLTPYMPAEKSGDGAPDTAAAKPGKSDWSDDPIDMSGLRAANAEILLKANSIKTGIVDPGVTDVHVILRDANLETRLNKLSVFDGGITGVIKADARKAKAKISLGMKVQGLQAREVLGKFADYSDLLGRVDADMNMTTTGATERQLVSALNGSGRLSIKDGALIGINLAEQMKGLSPENFKAEYDKTKKTDFAEMGGTFTARNGVITNKDFKMLAPLLRVTGAGTVPLPPRKVDYRVVPKLVASLSGQGGGSAAGVGLPLLIKGSWDDPSIVPDLEGIVKGVVGAPVEAVEGVAKQLGKGGAGVGKALESLTGGGSSSSGDEKKKSPLGGALKGLNSLIK